MPEPIFSPTPDQFQSWKNSEVSRWFFQQVAKLKMDNNATRVLYPDNIARTFAETALNQGFSNGIEAVQNIRPKVPLEHKGVE